MPEKLKGNGTQPPSLEQRVVTALSDTTLTAVALAALVEETNTALTEAERLAESEKTKAFDPALSPDPRAAHAAMVDASFAADRLRTLLPRLRVRFAEAVVRERASEWLAERDQFEAQWLDRVVAARTAYDAALNEMLQFFQLISEFSAARSVLLSRRPDQCGMETMANPIPLPKTLADTRLFDFNGAQTWPDPAQINKIAVEMSSSVALLTGGDPEQFSPNWWRAAQRRQAAIRAEGERHGQRLLEMGREQEERQNAEARARWIAAHGAS